MLALTSNEVSAILVALVSLGILGFLLLLRDSISIRERVTRLEESVRSLLNTSRKED